MPEVTRGAANDSSRAPVLWPPWSREVIRVPACPEQRPRADGNSTEVTRGYADHMSRRTTADTPLTVKQTKFAAAVANGTPRIRATVEAGYVPQKVKAAHQRRASEIANRPNVAAEIRRLTWLALPCIDDTRGMREHAVRVLSDLSRSAVSEEVRLKSALALFKIATTTAAASDPRASDQEQDRLLSALRKLYAQVRGVPSDDDDGMPDVGPAPRPLDDEPIDIQALVVRVPDGQE
jgi:hypothetical protein